MEGLALLGGGPTTALRDVVHQLATAAQAMDSPTCASLVRDALAAHGVIGTWTQVLQPVLADAGRRYANTGQGIDVEHVLSTVVVGELLRATALVPGEPAALLACAPARGPLAARARTVRRARRGRRRQPRAGPGDAPPGRWPTRCAAPRPGSRSCSRCCRPRTTRSPSCARPRPAPELFAAGPGWVHTHPGRRAAGLAAGRRRRGHPVPVRIALLSAGGGSILGPPPGCGGRSAQVGPSGCRCTTHGGAPHLFRPPAPRLRAPVRGRNGRGW